MARAVVVGCCSLSSRGVLIALGDMVREAREAREGVADWRAQLRDVTNGVELGMRKWLGRGNCHSRM